jgi:tripartite-type tricarboxylate transporter receptor subunit TctC
LSPWRLWRVFLASLAFCLCNPALSAETYPSRPIHFVVPYPAGGPLDLVARLLAQKMGESMKQPVVVENKPGAGGNLGAQYVARSSPDGYTILMGAVATHAINPTLYANLPYDPVKDFAPITEVATTPNVLVVNPSVPARTLREFIAHAKAHPGMLNFGSGGSGSAGHLAGELFKSVAGVEMTHVPYKGAAPAVQDLVAGQVQLMFDNLASASAQVKAGRTRAVAVTGTRRSALLPEVPTFDESGLPGFDIGTWFGVFVPAATPREARQRLHAEITRALALPDVRETMLGMGAEPVGNSPEAFAAFIAAEAAKYAKVVKASGARAD